MISIITVCYNSQNMLAKTIDSLLGQTNPHFEYIIIDGGSTDETDKSIKKSISKVKQNIEYFDYISEPDNGIYDAMNKGAFKARGDWLLFLNAGDLLYDKKTVENLYDFINENGQYGVIYGDTLLSDDGLYKYQKPENIDQMRRKMPFCHQSALIKRELLIKSPYSAEYRIVADYEFFLKYYLDGGKFLYYEKPISIYDYNGVSSKKRKELWIENRRLLSAYHLPIDDAEEKIIKFEKQTDNIINRLLPPSIMRIKHRWYRIRSGWTKNKGKCYTEAKDCIRK